MLTKTKQEIIDYIDRLKRATVIELMRELGISRQAAQKHMRDLIDKGFLTKYGSVPHVYYVLTPTRSKRTSVVIDKNTSSIIDKHFLFISATGERQEGIPGFIAWCTKHKLPIDKTAHEYEATLSKYNHYRHNGFIDGTYKLRHTFPTVYLDKSFYLDFYSIERFGKTKLGQLLLYAKQSQDRGLIRELVEEIRPKIELLLSQYAVNAIGFIPPTVKRELQFMRELERQLHLQLSRIPIVKAKTAIVVPQKTLTKLDERIENAHHTIFINDTPSYDTVLLIDDALGSGATLNETARKLKEQRIAHNVIGLAITGSFSGFEIISEV